MKRVQKTQGLTKEQIWSMVKKETNYISFLWKIYHNFFFKSRGFFFFLAGLPVPSFKVLLLTHKSILQLFGVNLVACKWPDTVNPGSLSDEELVFLSSNLI